MTPAIAEALGMVELVVGRPTGNAWGGFDVTVGDQTLRVAADDADVLVMALTRTGLGSQVRLSGAAARRPAVIASMVVELATPEVVTV